MLGRQALLFVTALAVAALGHGCNEDGAEDKDKAEETNEASSEEPDDEAVVEIEEDVDPAPDPGVVLLEAGKGPHQQLRWTPTAGAQRSLVVRMRVNTRTGDEPAPLSPRVRLDVDAVVDTADESGTIARSFAITALEVEKEDEVDDEAIAAMQAELGDLAGKKGVVESGTLGEAKDLAVTGALSVDPRVAKFVSALRHAWSHLAIPLPTEPVGKGARWTATRRIDLQGMDVWQITTYTLEAISGSQIEVKGDVAFRLAEPASQPVGFDPVTRVTGLSASGTVEGRFDLAAAAPIDAHVSLSAAFEAEGKDGGSVPGKVGVDLTIDEDWLAQPDERVTFKGRFTQGGLVWGVVEPGTKVWHDRRRVKVSDTGDFLLGFGRDADRKSRLAFAFPGSPVEKHVVHVEPREFELERIDGLPEEMVNPDREARREMAKHRNQIKKLRAKTTTEPYYRSGFRMPLRGKITSTYGRARILNGEDHGFHWGLDIAARVGKPVRAPAPGKVVYVAENVPLAGTTVMIDHGHGLTSSFLHLKTVKVAVGDEVKAGKVIATVGVTGRTTGAHLDWRMNLHDDRIDPQMVLSW